MYQVKLLNLINPANPLGTVITDTEENREYYRKIYCLAEKYNFMIFDDLVYWGTEHDLKNRAMPFLKAVPEAKDRVIMALGPSKSIGGARMRSGMLVAPEWFIQEVRQVVLNVNSGISAFNQYVMAAAFNMANDTKREAFLEKNAIEYALRRDVCIVGIMGEHEVLSNAKYGIDQERMLQIKTFIKLAAYVRLLIKKYNEQGLPRHIKDAFLLYDNIYEKMLSSFEKEQWFQSQSKSTKEVIVQTKVASSLKKIKFPDELHLISYMYHK